MMGHSMGEPEHRLRGRFKDLLQQPTNVHDQRGGRDTWTVC